MNMTKMSENTTSAQPYILPAEWSRQDAVLIAWPHADTDWAYMLDRVTACYADLAHAILPYATLVIVAPDSSVPQALLRDCNQERIAYVDIDTNDTWTRDYGPVTTVAPDGSVALNDFCFNGWGLKFAADLDNLVTRKLHFSGIFGDKRCINRLSFVFEGGAIESDGNGTLLTTTRCLLSPNRNGGMSRREIGQYIKHALGARKLLWLDHGALAGDDTDSHIDTLARFAPDNTILYVGCQDPTDEHYEELLAMKHDLQAMRNADGEPFHLMELPLPKAVYDGEGNRLPATYANFLVINGAVLVPIYSQPKLDELACRIIEVAFPGYRIVPVECSALIQQHGSLHCATMQLPYLNF